MIRVFRSSRPNPARSGGYSMVEIAIILGVISSVIGVLWIAASQAWEYTRREQVRETIATTVANARSYFGGQAGVPATWDFTGLTNQLLLANVIPSSLQRPTNCGSNLCADNPWGSFTSGAPDPSGTFRVCNWAISPSSVSTSSTCTSAAAGISPFFGISLTSLYRKSCVALVETMSSATEPTGLVDININGTNMVSAPTQHAIQPVTDTDAANFCNAVADGSASVTFVYRVVAPSP